MVRMVAALTFTEAHIRRVAGARSFVRGFDYRGAVEDLRIAGTEITANVSGTR